MTRRYTGAMKLLQATLLTLACALPAAGFAQWQWIDKDGRKVFSDQSPPADIPANKILKQPGGRAPAPDAATTAASAEAASPKPAAAPAPKISGKDKELEEKKKQAEAAEAEKKKAESEKLAKARAENCERAKKAKASFDSGVRITQLNAKGEREFLDDKARASETKRLQGIIDSDCKAS
jgi:hypothetical protein